MKKKDKKSNPNTELQEISKAHTWSDIITNESFIFFPGKDEWRQRLIYTLYKFFEDPSRLVVEEFLIEFKIPKKTFHDWMAKYSDIKEAWQNVKEQIAVRRKLKCFNFGIHYQSAYRDMHLYDKEWDVHVNQYWAKLKKEAEPDKTVQVVIEQYPHSDQPKSDTDENRDEN